MAETLAVRLAGAAALCALLVGCGTSRPITTPPVAVDKQAHVPDFARKPFVPFARENVVAIALREWRLFGSPVNDAPPDEEPELQGDAKPERQPGLWQRVGEYWWLGQDADNPFNGWTGRHDSFGTEFPWQNDGQYAWSAAFVSYVMRIAGAGTQFPYSPSHSTYIDIAARMAQGTTQGWDVTAERMDAYAPQPGDLICYGRQGAQALRFEDLPAPQFASHCDIVIGPTPQGLAVIGGNVDDAVTMKHIPVSTDGHMADAAGVPFDRRYPWMVVLRVLYQQSGPVS